MHRTLTTRNILQRLAARFAHFIPLYKMVYDHKARRYWAVPADEAGPAYGPYNDAQMLSLLRFLGTAHKAENFDTRSWVDAKGVEHVEQPVGPKLQPKLISKREAVIMQQLQGKPSPGMPASLATRVQQVQEPVHPDEPDDVITQALEAELGNV